MKKQIKKNLMNQKGFTLIEIISVLVLLGILAAVAVPKYLDLQGDAKIKAAQGQVAELKSTLSQAYAKYLLANGGTAPTGTQTVTQAGFTSGTAANVGATPDIWNVTLTAAGSVVTVTVTNRDGDTGYAGSGTWNVPS